MSYVGSNLAGVSYYSGEMPFIDRMKTSGQWGAQGPNWQAHETPIPVDKQGYVTELPAGAMQVYTMVGVDPLALPMTDRYVITYNGKADFGFIGAKIISSEPGKFVVEATGITGSNDYDEIGIALSNIDEGDHARNIHVVREDQVDLFDQGKVFNPDFLDRISTWDTLRFMDWNATNSSQQVDWSDRTTVDDRSWADDAGNGTSVPIEIMIKLANEAHSDMWYNVPAEASDDYVRNALKLIHDNLDPTLRVHVEYSNEVWNWSFDQAHYALAQGDELWGNDANRDGKIDANDAREHVGDGYLQFYGYRSAQIAAMAKDVWGDDAQSRLVTEISTQTAWRGLETSIFTGADKAHVGAISDLFDDYAITGYFGSDLSNAAYDATDAATVLGWARSGDAGVQAALQQITSGGLLRNNNSDSLANTMGLYVYQAAIAHQYGMTLSAYEGGASLVASVWPADVQPEIIDFYNRIINDPGMAALYTKNIAGFTNAGGSLFNQFNDVDGVGPYGIWGTLNNIYQPLTDRWKALDAANGEKIAGLNVNGTAAADALFGGAGRDTVHGLGGDDRIYGGAGTDTLYGQDGKDLIYGQDGDDYIDGGRGADTLIGGLGNDTYLVDDSKDVVFENAGEGYDRVLTSATSYTLPNGVEAIEYKGKSDTKLVGNALDNGMIGGSRDDVLWGKDGSDTLTGNAGNDRLHGGAGADRMVGGDGNDVYFVDSAGDVVTEYAGQGTDSVETTLSSYSIGANVENLTFEDVSGPVQAYGNGLNNAIWTLNGNDSLFGGAGDDMLYGRGGNDWIDGGTGADRMWGGAGDDTYTIDSASDSIGEKRGEGTDSVYAGVTFRLGDWVENLILTGNGDIDGRGNDLANSMSGNAGENRLRGFGGNDSIAGQDGNDRIEGGDGDDRLNGGNGADEIHGDSGRDVLDGGTGADRIWGGAGDDTYYVDDIGDKLFENTREGTDSVYASVSYTLSDNIEMLTISGAASAGIGNQLANTLSDGTSLAGGRTVTLDGAGGDDLLWGGANRALLIGGSGNDTLIGGGNDDVIVGGVGVDSLRGNGGADRFTFADGDLGRTLQTTDTVRDFARGEGDKIDLSGIDAIRGGSDDQFTVIGGNDFSRRAGELQITDLHYAFQVSGDTDGDGTADFTLLVATNGTQNLNGGDFVL